MTGILNLVSVGPGFADLIIPRAETALKNSDIIVAYELYLRWIQPWIKDKEIHTPPLTQEKQRALLAIEKARQGARVALISSGDIGVYAMAALAFDELHDDDKFEVNVIPGITSANACASLLGSPLSHDFATLSLSDLLCPWDWIEQRATHIAAADLSCVMYNVQSADRQDGVYKILQIMLDHKSPDTFCGIVKNAYRPGQIVKIHQLGELPSVKFDMLTSIVIGNRFTQRKNNYIFTPRGYNDWQLPNKKTADQFIPDSALWIYTGTSDGNELALKLCHSGYQVVISTATKHGGELAQKKCPNATIWNGPKGIQARRKALLENHARVIIDATHPYAAVISKQLMELSAELDIPYLRFERSTNLDEKSTIVHSTIVEAIEHAITIGQKIFLGIGYKDLHTLTRLPGRDKKQWFARITAEPKFIQQALNAGIPQNHLCAMQGPFSKQFNIALWRDWGIDCVITKNSGTAGGFDAKIEAAKELNIPLLVIQKPELDYPVICSDFESIQQQLSLLHNN